MPYYDTDLTIRVPRKLKEEAILLRLPLSAICRAAIKEKILSGNGGLPVEKVRSTKQAAQLFNKIQPVFDALITENYLYELQASPIPLVLLKSKISVIPDHFLRDFVEFLMGGHFSEQILTIYLEERLECIKTADNAESGIISPITSW